MFDIKINLVDTSTSKGSKLILVLRVKGRMVISILHEVREFFILSLGVALNTTIHDLWKIAGFSGCMENVVYSEVMYMYTNFSVFGFLISMLPLFLIILALRWVRFIYQNSEKQVEQNEKIIELLTEIKEENKKESRWRTRLLFVFKMKSNDFKIYRIWLEVLKMYVTNVIFNAVLDEHPIKCHLKWYIC